MPYASRICSIFPLWMESKALVKSTNINVACRFFARTPSRILRMVNSLFYFFLFLYPCQYSFYLSFFTSVSLFIVLFSFWLYPFLSFSSVFFSLSLSVYQSVSFHPILSYFLLRRFLSFRCQSISSSPFLSFLLTNQTLQFILLRAPIIVAYFVERFDYKQFLTSGIRFCKWIIVELLNFPHKNE